MPSNQLCRRYIYVGVKIAAVYLPLVVNIYLTKDWEGGEGLIKLTTSTSADVSVMDFGKSDSSS